MVSSEAVRRWTDEWALLEPCLDLKAIQRSVGRGGVPAGAAVPGEGRVAAGQQPAAAVAPGRGGLTSYCPGSGRERNTTIICFPVLLRDREERTAMMAAMWARFVDTSKIYSGVVKECRQFGYAGGCPVAESVADRLITLPNYAALTGQDIDHVAQVFLSELRGVARQTRSRGTDTASGTGIRW